LLAGSPSRSPETVRAPPATFTKLYPPDRRGLLRPLRLTSTGTPSCSRERRVAMSDTVETPQPPTPPADSPRRRFFRRAAIATVVAGLATAVGFKALAFGHGFGGWQRHAFMGEHLDPARMDEQLDRMLKHLYVEVDATDAQKQQL